MLVSAFRVRLGSRIAAAPARRLAYNIFDEEPKAQLAHADHGDTKKIAEQIFIQHAAANVLMWYGYYADGGWAMAILPSMCMRTSIDTTSHAQVRPTC